jgi:phosphatidylserine/phosphatidylglycerophosphate/cardiolipin synthase-like enzyme
MARWWPSCRSCSSKAGPSSAAKALAGKAYFPPLQPAGQDIVRAIGSTPDDPYSLIYLTLISAIGNAEKQVQLTHAYFVPDPQLLKALSDAAARGVEVKLILPSHSDSELVFNAGRSHYSALLKAGVRIYERRGALLHSKTALIDGVWSCVGSTNLDWRSFLDNDEINAVVLGREFAPTNAGDVQGRPGCIRRHRSGAMAAPAADLSRQGMVGHPVPAPSLALSLCVAGHNGNTLCLRRTV